MKSAVFYNRSLNHVGEEVCGDHFQSGKTEDSKIMVMSDGLGSGIKASILSILTTKIISTMMEKGVGIEEVVSTITKTLPVCKVRGIAYSTFTIVQVFNDGKTKIINYDNPRVVVLKRGKIFRPNYQENTINKKRIKTYEFNLEDGDFIFVMSDGLVHAGLGNLLNFGWGIDDIEEYIEDLCKKTRDIKEIVDNLIELTNNYYGFEPGDDVTLVGIQSIEKPKTIIFTGPPLDPRSDNEYAEKFMNFKGKKIICGGTTGNIISKITGNNIKIDIEKNKNSSIPPHGDMDGVDIVTEGVLTIQAVNKMISCCKDSMYDIKLVHYDSCNGAEKMFLLMRESEEIHFIVGRKVNVIYHNPLLPFEMSVRSNLIRELASNLERLGKKIVLEYC